MIYVEHAFDVVVAIEDRFEAEHLLRDVPQVSCNYLQSSGYRVPDHREALLARLWSKHMASLR